MVFGNRVYVVGVGMTKVSTFYVEFFRSICINKNIIVCLYKIFNISV